MKRLFLDFDCTIVDSVKTYCNIYNKLYKDREGFKEAAYAKVNRYDLKDQCPMVAHQEEIFSSKEFFKHLEFMPDAKEVIERLSKEYELIICSIGTLDNISYKAKWIKNNLEFIKNVVLISNNVEKGGIKTDKSVINMKNAIFIDDHGDNLASSNAELKICFGKEYEWNKNWEGQRCFSWKEVEDILLEEDSHRISGAEIAKKIKLKTAFTTSRS
ncbi:HAD hydrolase-like protein [Clostridium bovifaecis]|uniref:HAD hydrolase-like protein n=1 Tax=Clostridium bovifaecis TaxID=2184719 RepID=A0A6I6F1P0_9CLOT|nr:HAD hydrolase-like protein [Clostridium bovifaecis]